jgi:hypothetical protein
MKREVRRRCAFGCVLCGKPLYAYDHIVPFEQVTEHAVDNLVLLCDSHHREKTNLLLTEAQVRRALERPFNLVAGQSSPYGLRYEGGIALVEIGSVGFSWTDLRRFPFVVPLVIDNLPIVALALQDGNLLVTMQLLDSDNQLLVNIRRNELVYSIVPWDITFVGQHLTVRTGTRQVFAQLRFDPPSAVAIERASLFHNGTQVDISADGIVVPSVNSGVSSLTIAEAMIGVTVGRGPNVPTLIHMPSNPARYEGAPADPLLITF